MTDAAHTALSYCPDLFAYQRRKSREVMVGNVGIGGDNPIRIQSMITSDTRDTDACVKEVLELAAAGCEIVRVTAQTRVYAENLENIRNGVRAAGCDVPLVADIHFKPDAALEAAKWVEKVRVNPGNYADKKKFETREYTDDQYAEELERIREEFTPLVELCKELGRAIRIGTNHGSLSDRIMNRYGDTPLGMVESALEFARIARDNDYHNFVFSMKASNPKVMIEAYRLLVARLTELGDDWNYPIHLGVTEAGDGEDGRIKSAIGIGSLLSDGIGDTIRVSLTEDPVYEIPVAKALVANIDSSCCVSQQSVPVASSRSEIIKKNHTYLPHWTKEDGIYAVTFRLDDSLPASVIDDYISKKELIQKKIDLLTSNKGSKNEKTQLLSLRKEHTHLYSKTIESQLHNGLGSCIFNQDTNAKIVSDAIHFFDNDRYELLAWCIMPNHVHLVLKPINKNLLKDIMHSIKSFTAKKLNAENNTTGVLWKKEYYDHLIRDGEDLINQIRYVLNNPNFLDEWQWVGSKWGQNWEITKTAFSDLLQDAARTDCCETQQLQTLQRGPLSYDPFSYNRRKSHELVINGHKLGGANTVRVFTSQEKWNAVAHKIEKMGDFKPEVVAEQSGAVEVNPLDREAINTLNANPTPTLVTIPDGTKMAVIHAYRLLACKLDAHHPILLKDTFTPSTDSDKDFQETLLTAARNIGSLLCDGIGDAILIQGEEAPGQSLRLAYNILQAAGTRIFKTDYVACPSCGRTLFNLQETTQKIRSATGHLKGVRIAVMGCIVNGPGEMADADFGYVGGAPNKINLYINKTPVKFNIPEAEAVDRLIDLIKENDRWIDPPKEVVSI